MQAEELQEFDTRKDVFLATLAHELRNPLAPILTGLQLLQQTSDTTKASDIQQMMDRQLRHMVRLIDDLLDISRIKSGKVTLQTENMTLQSICKNALEGCQATINQSAHQLETEWPEEAIWVNADATRAGQVLMNLLTNAAKYTPERGKIRLVAGVQDAQTFVRVVDNGLGIPEEMLGNVFDMFTQINKTLDRAQGGLGIGLALAKRLIEMHGGTITVQSEGSNKGSTFTMWLPKLDGVPTEASAVLHSANTAEELQSLRVMVIDDNVDAADSLAMLLEMHGHTTQTVFSGLEAEAAVKQFQPDAVLCDIGLPSVNGYEVARRLRNQHGDAMLLIALTGLGSDEDKRRTLNAGFNHHFVKPVDVEVVLAILEEFGRQRN